MVGHGYGYHGVWVGVCLSDTPAHTHTPKVGQGWGYIPMWWSMGYGYILTWSWVHTHMVMGMYPMWVQVDMKVRPLGKDPD